MSKKDVDFDKELEKLARKTNVSIKKSEFAYESQLKKLDNEIDRVASKKIKEFDSVLYGLYVIMTLYVTWCKGGSVCEL